MYTLDSGQKHQEKQVWLVFDDNLRICFQISPLKHEYSLRDSDEYYPQHVFIKLYAVGSH